LFFKVTLGTLKTTAAAFGLNVGENVFAPVPVAAW